MMVTVMSFLHEFGHYAFADFFNLEILEVELVSWNPHVTVVDSGLIVWFLMAGQMYMPMFFVLYYAMVGRIYLLEYVVLGLGMLLGSNVDIMLILSILK
jgi:hypothetical protein